MPADISPNTRFEKLYRLYCSDMYRAAYSILHNHQDTEDAVQEAFVRIERNLDKISDIDSPRTRAFSVIVARNISINMARRLNREITSELTEDIAAPSDSAEELVLSKLGEEQLCSALRQLPDKYYDILFLTACESYSLKEAAQLLGISYDNAKSRALRARKQLRKILKEQGYE